jgi:hypothetical protein
MRQTKLSEKDLSVLRETNSAAIQHKRPYSSLKDYSLKHKVSMEWDLNDDATRDKMFKLKIDDYEVILDYEEFLKSGRFI